MKMSEYPEPDNSILGRVRDRIGWALATLGLAIATPWYRAMVSGLIEYGKKAAIADVEFDDEVARLADDSRE